MSHPLESALRLFHRSQDYMHRLVADLSDAQMTFRPHGQLNPPAWILGHLAIVNDYSLATMKQPKVCDETWHKLFGPDTPPVTEAMAGFTKATLLAKYDEGHAAVAKTILQTPAEILNAPHGIDFLSPWLINNQDLLTHLLTTHVCVHLGQLSAWRRVQSLPAV